MWAKVKDGQVAAFPYGASDLVRDYPQTSFPENPDPANLSEFGVVDVVEVPAPAYDPIHQTLTRGTPTQVEGKWTEVWVVADATPEEVEQRIRVRDEKIRQNRLSAYRNEADPLFFKAQRGEVTIDEWQAKVAEIKARYPKEQSQ